MKDRLFLCIIGIDGSGKTTLTRGIIKELEQYGISVEYRWGKFESFLLRSVISIKNKLFVRESNWKKNYEKSLKIKRNLFNNRFISLLYEYFVLTSYMFQVISKIAIPLKRGKNIICDRYIYDTIVDLAYDLNYSDYKIKNRLNQLSKLLPKPDMLLYISVPEEVAYRRKNDIPSIEFLKNKKKLYELILKFLKETNQNVIILDGTKTKSELRMDAKRLLLRYLEVDKE